MDIYKLIRRFSAIFGNYKFETLKKLFAKAYEMTRATQIVGMSTEASQNLYNNLEIIFNNILRTSIVKVTKGKVSLAIKHCNENEFSPGDLGKFIDRLHVDGYKVKLVLVDYLDTMSTTVTKFAGAKEYDTLGQITQELRNLSRIHKIPIMSPTQNKRESENVASKMTNEQTGDSYKKIRYSDFIYMCRMRPDLNFLSEGVRYQVIPKKQGEQTPEIISPEIVKISDKVKDTTIPFEVKITKSKDSEKDKSRFFLFCKDNLRIYNDINEYIKDSTIIDKNSSQLEKDINQLTQMAIDSVSIGGFGDLFGNTSQSVEFDESSIETETIDNSNVIEFPNPFEDVGL